MDSICHLVIPTLLCSSPITQGFLLVQSLFAQWSLQMWECKVHLYIPHSIFPEILLSPWGSATKYHQQKVEEITCFPVCGSLLCSSAHFSRPPTYSSFFPPQTFILQNVATGPSWCLHSFSLRPIYNPWVKKQWGSSQLLQMRYRKKYRQNNIKLYFKKVSCHKYVLLHGNINCYIDFELKINSFSLDKSMDSIVLPNKHYWIPRS